MPVRISVEQKVKFGEVLRLVGSHPALGNWEVGADYPSAGARGMLAPSGKPSTPFWPGARFDECWSLPAAIGGTA